MICSACDYDSSASVYGTYTIVIDCKTDSLNEIGINNSRNNWKYKKARATWERRLSRYIHRIPKAAGHRNVFFTRFYGGRRRPYDYGNLVGGFKPALDMLVAHDFLIDDKPKHCSEYYKQFKSPSGKDHVIIVLEDTTKKA